VRVARRRVGFAAVVLAAGHTERVLERHAISSVMGPGRGPYGPPGGRQDGSQWGSAAGGDAPDQGGPEHCQDGQVGDQQEAVAVHAVTPSGRVGRGRGGRRRSAGPRRAARTGGRRWTAAPTSTTGGRGR